MPKKAIGIIMFIIPIIGIVIICSILTKIWWTGPAVFIIALIVVKYFYLAIKFYFEGSFSNNKKKIKDAI